MDEDICKLIVDYGRTKIIGNEPQFLTAVLSAATAYAPVASEQISVVIIGESSGGKTHLQRVSVGLLPSSDVYTVTTSSEKAPIYSTGLRDPSKKFIKLAEYQKLPQAVLEFMKSMSGDDDDFVYEVTNTSSHDTDVITHTKKPYSVTYAQVVLDKELQTRIFLIPVDENININRCVAAIKLGAKQVDYRGRVYDFTPDVELEGTVRDAIESLRYTRMPVRIEFPFALIDLVNHSKPESKRHAQTINALICSSCRLNWMNRKSEDGHLIASSQDVVNVLSMHDILLATMMSIDNIDLLIYKFLCKNADQRGESIIRHIQNLGLTELTKNELNRRLDKLYDENYIIREQTTGGYQFSANPHKRILTLKIDWEQICEFDGGEVVDPITGERFANIVEYGENIESRTDIKSGKKDKVIVDDMEAKIREQILDTLDSPTSNKVVEGFNMRIARLANIQGLDYMRIDGILESMLNEGLIYQDGWHYRRKISEIGLDVEGVAV